MRSSSIRRTMLSILGFVLRAGLAGIMGMRFADTTSTAAPMPSLIVLENDLDAGVSGSFSVDAGDSHTELLCGAAGTTLEIDLRDPDGEQVFWEAASLRRRQLVPIILPAR
jgi:hypothetical protein